MRMFSRVAATLFLASSVAACKFPYPEDVPGDGDVSHDDGGNVTRAVGGAITGLWTGGAITLHLKSGGTDEDLAASAGQPFTFTHRLADGASYLVTVADDGPDHDCTVSNGSGRIDGADVSDLAVACTNLIPHGVAISTPVPFTFDPRTTRYPLAVSILQQEVSVTVTGPSLTSAMVAGQPVTLGQPSPPVPLGQGMTTVAIDVAKGPLSQRYQLVFDRGGAPIVEAQYIRAANAGPSDYFGTALAGAGEWLAIGAPGESSSSELGNDDALFQAGAVYMFKRVGMTWMQVQMLKGTALTSSRMFGDALAMDGALLVVGAGYDDAQGNNAGAAYVFRYDRAIDKWREEQRLTASDGVTGNRFGTGVAVSGDYVAIAAPHAANATGKIYIFRRSGSSWNLDGTIQLAAPAQGDELGAKIDLDGDTLAASTARGVHVYRRTGASWAEETFPAAAAQGLDVDLEGTELAIGNRVFVRAGSAWILSAELQTAEQVAGFDGATRIHRNAIASSASWKFLATERAGGTWVPQPLVTPSNGLQATLFGYAITFTSVGVAVGAGNDNGPGGTSGLSGTVWFFR